MMHEDTIDVLAEVRDELAKQTAALNSIADSLRAFEPATKLRRALDLVRAALDSDDIERLREAEVLLSKAIWEGREPS